MEKPSIGPKQRKAFWDKYLAAIVAVTALLFGFSSTAQTLDTTRVRQGVFANPGYDYIGLGTSKTLRLPQDTIKQAARDSGAIAYKNGAVYMWNGQNYIPVGGGADNSIATGSRTATGDYIQDWMQHWFFLHSLKALELSSDLPDPGHPDNNKVFRFYSDSTIDAVPLQLTWGLKDVSHSYTDSIHFELNSSKNYTYLTHWSDGGNKYAEIDINPTIFYPDVKIFAGGNSKSGFYQFGAGTATIQPSDSVRLLAIPATTAPKILGLRAGSGDTWTAVAMDAPSSPAHSWQQTLDISHNSFGRLVFDTSIVKPTGPETPAEHVWFQMNPLVKEDSAYTSPFYWNQFGGYNNGRTNEVMIWGWNMSAGGGHVESNKPGLGYSLESNFYNNADGSPKRYMEAHLYYVDSDGIQYRPSSYTINTIDGTATFYHSVNDFNLRTFGPAGTNTPYFTVAGFNGTTTVTQSYLSPSDQGEVFAINSDFNQDANTSSFTITNSTSKPSSLFNLNNFSLASFPDASFTGKGYGGTSIAFGGTTVGSLGRLLFDSIETKFENFTNVPINLTIDGVTTLLTKTKATIPTPLTINTNADGSAPFAGVQAAVNSSTLEAAGWFQNNGTSGTKWGLESYSTGSGGTNEGLYVIAANGVVNRSIRIQGPVAAPGNHAIYSDATAQSYFSGKIGIGLGNDTPDSTLSVAGSLHVTGGVKMEGLPLSTNTDTTLIIDNGTLKKMVSRQDQIVTSGTTVTINDGVTRLFVDPSTALSSLDITFPANPYDGQVIKIYFGGTIQSGSLDVVTSGISSWSSPGAGFVPALPSSTTPIKAGVCMIFEYRAANTYWYQIQ